MQEKVNRIIIDTNLWISFLISNNYSKLDNLLFSGNVRLIFSQELLDEFLEVVKRPKLRRFFLESELEILLQTIEEFADFINVVTPVEACRDPKDNFLLSLAVDGKADVILTGDKDLLTLHPFGETAIITISEFLSTS